VAGIVAVAAAVAAVALTVVRKAVFKA